MACLASSRVGGVASEVVWDANCHGVAQLADDAALTVGRDAGITPECLLAAAANAALMVAFLERAAAAGLAVLGYVSASRFEPAVEVPGGARLVLLPSMLVAADDVDRAGKLLQEALAEAPVLRQLLPEVALECSIQPMGRPAGRR
ncbi:MAG: hypothetical protein AB1635_19600 [Acidobacteriota bacterium]